MMHDYAFFLVGAYGMFALAIVIEIVGVRRRMQRARAAQDASR